MITRRRGISAGSDPIAPGRPYTGRWFPFLPRAQPKSHGRIGDLEVRLACNRSDMRRAQRLRYRVFHEEMSAIPGALAMMSRRDEDPFDAICDHLLVLDHGAGARGSKPWRQRPQVVGTYRLLRQDVAGMHDGFYSQGEYDIAALVDAAAPERSFMEVGRSCVLKPYRTRRTIELLWQGIWNYTREHGIDVLLGCASFEGTNPRRHAQALSFLHHNALAPARWRVRAHDPIRVDMNMLPASEVAARTAIRSLPPLIKGYLRLGASVGEGAVIDHEFGTTDVFIILPMESIDPRYFARFGAPDEFADPANPPGRLN